LTTPPNELVARWSVSSPIQPSDESWAYELFIAHQAARWGADQELEACATYIARSGKHYLLSDELICARRPKPPSLKEQALALINSNKPYLDDTAMDIIRKALEGIN
jgi:hypothetical protein